MTKFTTLFAAMSMAITSILPAATAEALNAATIREDASRHVSTFLRTWVRPTRQVAESKIAKDRAVFSTLAQVRDVYALALLHGIDLGFPLQAALDNGFTQLDAMLRKYQAEDGSPTLPVRTIANILARGLLEGGAAAFAGVRPPVPTDPTEPIAAPHAD